MFAPVLVVVMRAIAVWLVFKFFKMILHYLSRELVVPVKQERIRRASARILVDEEGHWEPESPAR